MKRPFYKFLKNLINESEFWRPEKLSVEKAIQHYKERAFTTASQGGDINPIISDLKLNLDSRRLAEIEDIDLEALDISNQIVSVSTELLDLKDNRDSILKWNLEQALSDPKIIGLAAQQNQMQSEIKRLKTELLNVRL